MNLSHRMGTLQKRLTVVSGMERSGFPETQYSALVSGNPFHSIPETTVHYFCVNMKGAIE